MRKLKIFEHTSLDGVVQHSADESAFPYSNWTVPFRTPEGLAKLCAHSTGVVLNRYKPTGGLEISGT